MRIVSDFDGVWTDPRAEAEAVGARQLERLAEALGGDRPRAEAVLAELRARVRARPEAHGWLWQGELSAFADEDPYIFHNAVAAALYEQGGEAVAALRRAGLPDAGRFAAACFEEGTAAWRAAHPTHLLPEAAEAVQRLLAAGHEVVIVSNSSTARVASILADLGLRAQEHERLVLRGGARKFVLTPAEPAGLEEPQLLAGRPVRLRRLHYYRLLEELRPAVVIGDVLSLDLVLPAALRREQLLSGPMRLYLKRNPYTPDWALMAAAEADIEVVGGLAELAERLGD
ncbi:MAG: hypothetical protein KatS3mg102_2120 [Planctomycetota bacterium]|nr:MAG: hypothetical protein KatS3mg102_2120 [Planctomycetota bacterium]